MADGDGAAHTQSLADLASGQRRAHAELFGAAPAVTASAPGRINVIGEHTDYNNGLALPGAIDRWVVVTLSPRADGAVRVHSEAFDETVELSIDQRAGGAHGWPAIPLGAARLMVETAGVEGGYDIVIGGNVPRGAGLSSSAAVEMALLNALRRACDADPPALSDLDLVLLAQRIEHEYLGAPTGLMDQYTSQLARAGRLMLIDFDTVSHEHIAARLDGWVWLLFDSKVRHELAGSAYGERVEQMRAALRAVQESDPTVGGFRDVRERHATAIGDRLLRRRMLHYVRENDRVRAAAAAATAGDAARLGELLAASHASLRDDYQVSCDELDALVDAASALDGCAGARMMGGGFGGCTINVVRAQAVDEIVARVAQGFTRRFGDAPAAAVYRLVDGARVHEEGEGGRRLRSSKSAE